MSFFEEILKLTAALLKCQWDGRSGQNIVELVQKKLLPQRFQPFGWIFSAIEDPIYQQKKFQRVEEYLGFTVIPFCLTAGGQGAAMRFQVELSAPFGKLFL